MRIRTYKIPRAAQFTRQSRTFVIVVLALLFFPRLPHLVAAQTATRNDPVEREFLTWARQDMHPVTTLVLDAPFSNLEPLRRMIGNATLVSLGEGLHGGAEPLELRNLLFRFLVEKMEFTAIAIESGITEGFGVNQYVLGGPGDLKTVVAQGFGFGFDKLPQNATLVQWMREYNTDSKHSRKIQFYGFDVSSKVALDDALRYLDGVDSAAATTLRNRISSIVPMLNFSRFSDAPNNYPHLSQAQRDLLTAAIADMITLFELREAAYIAASSDQAYEWAYRSAIAARQMDDYLRQVPIGWTPKDGIGQTLGTSAVADRAKFDNVRWIKEQQGLDGKILLFAHRDHVATALTSIRFSPAQNAFLLPPMMGTYLPRRYGEQLVTIGNLLGEDTSNCKTKRPPAPSGSLEGLLSTLKPPMFLLDLRTAPRGVAAWLKQTRELYGLDLPDSLNVGEAFNIVFFSRLVPPAVPCPQRAAPQ
ncbi:MAG: erythromycin esterase family protein [Pyrinomonadaceae bacterium]